jgi:hypothetical protein
VLHADADDFSRGPGPRSISPEAAPGASPRSTQDELNPRSSSPHQGSRLSPRTELIRRRPSIPRRAPPSIAFLSTHHTILRQLEGLNPCGERPISGCRWLTRCEQRSINTTNHHFASRLRSSARSLTLR